MILETIQFYTYCFIFSSFSALAMFLRLNKNWRWKPLVSWMLLAGCQGCIVVVFYFGDPVKLSNIYSAYATAATIGLLQPWFLSVMNIIVSKTGLKIFDLEDKNENK